MQLTTRAQGDMLVVTAQGARIDASGAIAFKERMREIVAGAHRRVVLDLSQVDFLDSSGLGAVVAVRKMLGSDRVLELAGLTPTVEKVFRLTRMDTIFVIHPAVPDRLRDAG